MNANFRNAHIGIAIGIGIMLAARILDGDASEERLAAIDVVAFFVCVGITVTLVLREESRRDKLKR